MRRRFSIPLTILLLAISGVFILSWLRPDVKNKLLLSKDMFLLSRAMKEEFGAPVKTQITNGKDLQLTLTTRLSKDTVANERFARRLATFARSRFAGDSLNAIQVVLQEEVTDGSATTTRASTRYAWTLAQLRDPASSGRASNAAGTVASNVAAVTVTPAGNPARPPARSPASNRGAASPLPPAAFARLAAADPGVRWVTDSALVAEVDGDRIVDTVVVGRKSGEIHVGLVRSNRAAPQILIFDVGAGAICGANARVSLESLDFDPKERGLGSLDGFRRSTTRKGIGLGDGDCTPVHIFWSQRTQHIEWYQR